MKFKKIFNIISIILLSLIILSLLSVLAYVNISIKEVKNMDVKLSSAGEIYSTIYDSNGNELDIVNTLKNNYIKLDNIPQITKQAFISIEDKKFYEHNGLNYKRIAKATLNNLKSKSMKEGASTITQQLVKNKYLSNEKTLDRKIKEAYLSKKLEKSESKDKILETYLNTIYFGNGAYGIGNASQRFFGKSPEDLTLSESCVLAGCIKSPKNYSPLNDIVQSKNRRDVVLQELLKDNKISEIEYQEAIEEELNIDNASTNSTIESLDLYTQFALEEASRLLNTNIQNVLYGGYKIYTNQNFQIQKKLDEIINDEKYYPQNRYGNIADSLSILIDNENYNVIAVSGKSDYSLVNIKRQPGSLIKPILTFAPAINEGLINAKTQILDEPIDIDGYSPNNVGNQNYGYISVEDIVAKSLNIPTIKITEELGLKKCKEYAKKCGINFNETMDNNLAVALGGFTDGITLKEITDSYSVLSNKGNYINSSFINKILGIRDTTIYKYKLSETHVYNTDTPYLMTDILKYSVKYGTSKKLSKFKFDVAGKTGTVAVKNSNLNTDAYSLAYTTSHTMSVWMGDYSMDMENYLEGSNNGGTSCTQIISDMFDYIYKDNVPNDFEVPETIEEIIIDKRTLDEDHIVVLGDNVPERYQEKCYVSKRYLPSAISNKFDTIEPFDFDIIENKNSCEITFDAKDYLSYTIYRKENNSFTPISSFRNKNGKINFVDKNMDFNITYTYYIDCTNSISNVTYSTVKKQAKLFKNFDNLLINENNTSDNISWLFS